MKHMCSSFPLLDRLKEREGSSFLPVLPQICIFPTDQRGSAPASCRTHRVHFFLPRNLSGNLMARIQKDTFQAWHGVQFLQKV